MCVLLHLVATAGVRDQDSGLRRCRDFDLVLPGADGLHDHDIEASRVHDVHDAGRHLGEAAEVAARRHRSHEHAAVGGQVLHALHHRGLDGQRMLGHAGPGIGHGRALGHAAEVEHPGDTQWRQLRQVVLPAREIAAAVGNPEMASYLTRMPLAA